MGLLELILPKFNNERSIVSGNTMKVSGFYHLLYIGTPPFQQSEKGKYSCIAA